MNSPARSRRRLWAAALIPLGLAACLIEPPGDAGRVELDIVWRQKVEGGSQPLIVDGIIYLPEDGLQAMAAYRVESGERLWRTVGGFYSMGRVAMIGDDLYVSESSFAGVETPRFGWYRTDGEFRGMIEVVPASGIVDTSWRPRWYSLDAYGTRLYWGAAHDEEPRGLVSIDTTALTEMEPCRYRVVPELILELPPQCSAIRSPPPPTACWPRF